MLLKLAHLEFGLVCYLEPDLDQETRESIILYLNRWLGILPSIQPKETDMLILYNVISSLLIFPLFHPSYFPSIILI